MYMVRLKRNSSKLKEQYGPTDTLFYMTAMPLRSNPTMCVTVIKKKNGEFPTRSNDYLHFRVGLLSVVPNRNIMRET